MLPADTIAEIATNLAALQLEPNTAAQILAAVFAPLLRSSDRDPPEDLPRQRAERRRRPRRAVRSKPRGSSRKRKREYKRHDARDRALAALRATPDATPSEIAKVAKVSRATVVHAREELAKEQRRAARKAARTRETSNPPDRRERAQRFLRDTLAGGPKPVTTVEAAAAKAHVDLQTLEQARGDLHVVTSRANTGGAQAVQWSLPG